MQTVHDAIRQRRRALGLTQEQVAVRAGVSPAAISRIECYREPTISTLRAVCSALGLELELGARLRSIDDGQLEVPSE